MAEIVNLRSARKARDRAGAEKLAAENRAKFGQTKAEKLKQRDEAKRAAERLEGHKREGSD